MGLAHTFRAASERPILLVGNEGTMHQPYVPILLLLGFVIVNAVAFLVISQLVSPQRPTAIKRAPYESGMPALGTAHERFSVKFYLVGILFIVFDIETVFLLPWAVIYRQLGLLRFVEAVVFIGILAVGYVYVWKRRAFEWS